MKPIIQLVGKTPTHRDKSFGPRSLASIKGVAWHASEGRGSPVGMARWKVDHDDEPGHSYGVHCHPVRHVYTLHQTNPVDVSTWHAWKHNPFRLGIVLTGFYDDQPWPDEAVDVVAEFSAVFLILIGQWDPWAPVHPPESPGLAGPAAAGHRELRWSTDKIDRRTGMPLPRKTCPGKAQSCDDLRAATARHLLRRRHYTREDAHRELLEAGFLLAEGVWP